MDANWITVVLLLFGIAVAVYGVYAYLRMFSKHKDDFNAATPPPVRRTAPASEDGQQVQEAEQKD